MYFFKLYLQTTEITQKLHFKQWEIIPRINRDTKVNKQKRNKNTTFSYAFIHFEAQMRRFNSATAMTSLTATFFFMAARKSPSCLLLKRSYILKSEETSIGQKSSPCILINEPPVPSVWPKFRWREAHSITGRTQQLHIWTQGCRFKWRVKLQK